MIPQTTLINDWSAGELDEKNWGRFGHPVHDRGAQKVENFQITEEAILTKRPGTEYVGTCYNSTNPARLIPFVYSKDEAYIIEMLNSYVRVWRNIAGTYTMVAETSSNVPWTTAQLFQVQYCQDNNGVYFAHSGWTPRALVRTAQDTFAMGDIVFVYHTGADYTSHATSNDSGDETFIVQEAIGATIPQQGVFLVEHASGQYDQYFYTSWATSTFSGITPALARDYEATDKMILGHRYHDNDAHQPFAATGNYPAAVAIVNGRVCFGGGTNDPQRVWECVAWGYERDGNNFVVQMLLFEDLTITSTVLTPAANWADPAVGETETKTVVRRVQKASHALDYTVASDRAEEILTMASGKHLLIGTTASEWIVPGDITSLNPHVEKPVTRYGSSQVQPTMIADVYLMTSLNKKRIREYGYQAVGQGYKAPNLTTFAAHITGTSGVKQMDVMRDPFLHAVFTRSDGELAVLTYEKEDGVLAWQRYTLPSGWTFYSHAVIPENDETVLYATVYNGTNYYIVRFKDFFPDTQAECMFVDAGYDVSTDLLTLYAANTVTCAWLADKTVAVVKDGVYQEDLTASGAGAIDLTGYDPAANQIWVGLKYTSKYRSVGARAQVQAGTSENVFKRVFGLFIRVYRTLDIKAGYNTYTPADCEDYSFDGDTWESGVKKVGFNGSYDREACINIVSDEPNPCTITSITPNLVAQEQAT